MEVNNMLETYNSHQTLQISNANIPKARIILILHKVAFTQIKVASKEVLAVTSYLLPT